MILKSPYTKHRVSNAFKKNPDLMGYNRRIELLRKAFPIILI